MLKMARTKLHIQKGRWNNGFQETIPNKLKGYFDRINYERSYFKALKKEIKENDLDNDMKNELNEN